MLHAALLERGAASFLFTMNSHDHADLWVGRWRLMARIIESGIDLVHSDADAVWVASPMPFFALEDVDLVVSRGSPDPEWLICMGWIYVRSSPAVISTLLPPFIEKLEQVGDDQVSRSAAWCGGVARRPPSDAPPRPTPHTTPTPTPTPTQRALNLVVRDDLRLKWSKNPLLPKTLSELVVGTTDVANTTAPAIHVLLLPNNVVRRHDCRVNGANDARAAVFHCRGVGAIDMKQSADPLAKQRGMQRMAGIWLLREDWEALPTTGNGAPPGGIVAFLSQAMTTPLPPRG